MMPDSDSISEKTITGTWTYVNKVVELYFLFSRGSRLANGIVGKRLRALQLAEVSSAAFVLWQIFTSYNYFNDNFRVLSREYLERFAGTGTASAGVRHPGV